MPKKAFENLTESMFYVLMALYSGEMCGTDISEFAKKISGGRVVLGPGTLYTLLSKFLKEKYIEETQIDGRKRTYALTQKGTAAYEAELSRLKACVSQAQSLINGEGKK